MKKWMVPVVGATMLVGACGVPAEGGEPGAGDSSGVLLADPWVRSTDGSQRPDMTALFVNITNPTSSDVTLLTADCGDVASVVEVHEMVMMDGEMVMREAEGGVVVPKESHEHLAPGGPHIMLRELTRELPAGGEEISCTLIFDNGQELDVIAPVKEFTEEQDTYHTHEDDE